MSHADAFRDGLIAAKAGKRMLARIQFEQVVEIDPDFASGWLWLAWTADSPNQAAEYLRNARDRDPNDPLIRNCLDVMTSLCDFEQCDRSESCPGSCETEDYLPQSCQPLANTDTHHDIRDESTVDTVDEASFAAAEESETDCQPSNDAGVEHFADDDASDHDRSFADADAAYEFTEIESDSTETDDNVNSARDDAEFSTPSNLDDRDATNDYSYGEVEHDEFGRGDRQDDITLQSFDRSTDEPADEESSASVAETTNEPSVPTVEGYSDPAECRDDTVGELEPYQDVEGQSQDESSDSPEASPVDDGNVPLADVDQAFETDLADEVTSLAEEVHNSVEPTEEESPNEAAWQAAVTDESNDDSVEADQPQATDAPPADPAPSRSIADLNRKDTGLPNPLGGVVLAVDDSPTVRKLVTMTLEGGGYDVRTAENGIEAMKMLVSFTPGLILLDVNMPRMDGYKLCKLIKSHDKTHRIPVVMLSGKDGVFDKLRGKLVGCNDYISKPFESAELLKTVRTYVGEPAPTGS